MHQKRTINILSWNVNGLRAIERKQALEWIDTFDVDLLCLQETKLSSSEQLPILCKKKFYSISINNSSNKGFSGTAIFSMLKADKEDFCIDIDTELDGRIIKQKFGKTILFNVYFPNGKLNKKRLARKIRFYQDFLEYCNKLKEKGNSIIICGDFNTAYKDIDLKKTKITNKSGFTDIERSCFDNFIKQGYVDTYRYIYGNEENAYTWWSYRSKGKEKNEGWRIDYILISEDLTVSLQDAFILANISGSDHCPIGISIDM